jgi:hypothetical protein
MGIAGVEPRHAAFPRHGVGPDDSRAAAPPLLHSGRRFFPVLRLQVAGSPEMPSQSDAGVLDLEEEDGGLGLVFEFPPGSSMLISWTPM